MFSTSSERHSADDKTGILADKTNYKGMDEFQMKIKSWITNNSDVNNGKERKSNENSVGRKEFTSDNVLLVIGNKKTGKTHSYLTGLSELINAERYSMNAVFSREEYRAKLIAHQSLKRKNAMPKDLRKINGLPKFDWNGMIVPIAMVIVPSREMGLNIFNMALKLRIRSKMIVGGEGYKKQSAIIGGAMRIVDKNNKENVDLVIATPEMLLRAFKGRFEDLRINVGHLRFMIVEEADLLCEPIYIDQMSGILNLVSSSRLFAMYLTSTKTEPLETFIRQAHSICSDGENSINTILHPQTYKVDNKINQIFTSISSSDPLEQLIETLDEIKPKSVNMHKKTLIFCNTVKCCQFITLSLRERGYKIASLHGEMKFDERSKSLKELKENCNILVTTNMASRISFPFNIQNVISFNFPRNVSDYLHRAHSISSDSDGIVNSFFSKKHLRLLKDIHELSPCDNSIEYRNVNHKTVKLLHLHNKAFVNAAIKYKNMKIKKYGKVGLKLTHRRNLLSPKNKRIMKRFYLKDKAIKKMQFLKKRSILKKEYALPKIPDRILEMSDSQEFIRMKRSSDGFLQIIPKRRSRINASRDSEKEKSVPITGLPSYEDQNARKIPKYHRNMHF
ncbi:DEAD box ATP-dependent RNA helicase family member protein [Theileria equi strain WA]|uniref:ATP-dependent RNA helicase n=1 Tax=Theileria equi strain WA TaxID=1537102 RepID=L1LGN6_THEEQ|nr:DEAD box ATP-dependent RNA helicase family member protein [Theileria equi strain WA]EKX74278.1 DEAD box ATP-dependent RNA helicase family member protein [Theileria equi strain WA]|eukprot:XP_004833730.1 DEAD box ATP-dependent RNA helicase family member protein [Theileria equi strain WA]